MASNLTNSGIDPQRVMGLVSNIDTIKKNIVRGIFDEIRGNVRNDINTYYEGQAATALMQNIVTRMTKCEDMLNSTIRSLVKNINEDLSSTQKTDQALS